MTVPSKAELRQLFDDETLATEAWTAEATLSWPSLRILSYLVSGDGASTGEIARAVNMDMREVRDYLDALAEAGIVEITDDTWQVAVEHVQFTMELDVPLLELSHSIDETASEPQTPGQIATAGEPAVNAESLDASEESDETEPSGVFGRLRQQLGKLFGR